MLRLSIFPSTRRRIALVCANIEERLWTRYTTCRHERLLPGSHVRCKSSHFKPMVSTPCSGYTDRLSLDSSLQTGDSVELKDGDFLRINRVSAKRKFVYGWRFCHTSKMNGLPQDLPNEVCWILHMKDGNLQNLREEFVEKISISEIVQKKQLILTNQTQRSLTGRVTSSKPKFEPVHDQNTLICRWKYVCCVKSNRRARPLASVQFYSPDNEWSAISRLRKDECDEGAMYPTDDGTLRDVGCGDNSKVNEYPESKNEYIDNLAEDLSRLNVKETNLSHGKQGESLSGDNLASNNKREGVYTFEDAFCGAGGVSRGVRWQTFKFNGGLIRASTHTRPTRLISHTQLYC